MSVSAPDAQTHAHENTLESVENIEAYEEDSNPSGSEMSVSDMSDTPHDFACASDGYNNDYSEGPLPDGNVVSVLSLDILRLIRSYVPGPSYGIGKRVKGCISVLPFFPN